LKVSLIKSMFKYTGKLFHETEYGGYDAERQEFVIKRIKTPRPWVNICANPDFGTLITEGGEMFSWYQNSYLYRITPRIDDSVLRQGAEKIYLKDKSDGTVWQPLAEAITRHGLGYSVFESNQNGLAVSATVLVPRHGSLKLVKLNLTNQGRSPKTVLATYYSQLVLGEDLEKTKGYLKVGYSEKEKCLKAQNPAHPDFPRANFFLGTNGGIISYETDRRYFVGSQGNLRSPAALRDNHLRSKVTDTTESCAALASSVRILPGRTKSLIFTFGVTEKSSSCKTHHTREDFERELEKQKSYWQQTNSKISIETPDEELNILFNQRLLYQILTCRLWGRTGFYQTGGAYGYRDQLQDIIPLSLIEPKIARAHILRAASRQFFSGGVQHWWHPPGNAGVRSHSSDAHLWLVYATLRYVELTGDETIFNEEIPYLLAGSTESHGFEYFVPESSSETYTLYHHCKTALERTAYLLGSHGLPLMLSGDWNDGLDLVGKDKRGESVWLAMFTAKLARDFLPIAKKEDGVTTYSFLLGLSENLTKRVEASAWDGGWYLRAFWDSGEPLGSRKNKECSIDSLPQSWATIAGLNPRRAEKALAAANSWLIDKNSEAVKLLDPPFDKIKYDPGYIIKYPPGVRENGGAYSHAAGWLAQANALGGKPEVALEILGYLNPFKRTATSEKIRKYQGEPYAMAADVCTAKDKAGQAGWTWYTGSASVVYGVVLESVLGIKVRGDKLFMDPSVPKSWPGFTVTIKHHKSTYVINVIRQRHNKTRELSLDGHSVSRDYVPLENDGRLHRVQLKM
jgi:cellobiose phosphorylase